jgi:hypothetical protein
MRDSSTTRIDAARAFATLPGDGSSMAGKDARHKFDIGERPCADGSLSSNPMAAFARPVNA